MTCIVKTHHLKVLFKEMQFIAFFIFHMEKNRMQVKNDLRCLRQKTTQFNRVDLQKSIEKLWFTLFAPRATSIYLACNDRKRYK